jgi:hypothetical protein
MEQPTNSPAAGTLPATLTPQEMSTDQLREWELTGKAPDREPSGDGDTTTQDPPAKAGDEAGKTAEAAAAEPGKQAASNPDALRDEAATETAKPEKKKAPGQKLSASERKAQIDQENRELQESLKLRKALRQELDAMGQPASPKETKKEAASSTVAEGAKDPAWKKYSKHPDAPKVTDPQFEDLADYAAAMGVFVAEKIAEEKASEVYDRRAGQDRESYTRDQEFFELADAAEQRASKELEADPGILDRIDDRWKALNPSDRLAPGETLSPAHFVKDRVTFHSDHPLKLAEWLTADGSKELKRVARLSPDRIIRELAIKDFQFGSPDSQETADDDAAVVSSKHVSKAPAPIATLGRKAAAARDPLEKAIKDGNQLEFIEQENRRSIGRRK